MTINTIETILAFKTKDTSKAKKELERINLELMKLNRFKASFDIGKSMQFKAKELKTQLKQADATKQLNFENQKLVKTLQAGQKATIGFNGAMLSLMFGGMAVKRFAGGALTSIFETYKKLIPESDKFNVATTKLSANWEFFKFQLAEAFTNSVIFQVLIAGAVKLLGWFQKLPDSVKTFIVAFLGILVVVGTLLIIIGTMALLGASIIDVSVSFGLLTKSVETGLVTMGVGFKAFLVNLGLFLVVVAVLYLAWKTFGEWQTKHLENMGLETTGVINRIISVFVTFAAGIVNIFVLLISTVIGLFIALGGGVKIVFDSILELALQLGDAIWSAIKAGFTGGDPLQAFIDTWDFDAVRQKVENGLKFTKDAFNGLSVITTEATKSVNAWEINKQIDWADATPIKQQTQETVINNNVFVSGTDEALAQGLISQEQYDAYNNITPQI